MENAAKAAKAADKPRLTPETPAGTPERLWETRGKRHGTVPEAVRPVRRLPAAAKVSELIEHLSSLDQDLPVFVNGYETGYHKLERSFLRVAWTFPNRYINDDEWYYGTHLESDAGAKGASQSVVIDRPEWPQFRYSTTETTANGWGGGIQHAPSRQRA